MSSLHPAGASIHSLMYTWSLFFELIELYETERDLFSRSLLNVSYFWRRSRQAGSFVSVKIDDI